MAVQSRVTVCMLVVAMVASASAFSGSAPAAGLGLGIRALPSSCHRRAAAPTQLMMQEESGEYPSEEYVKRMQVKSARELQMEKVLERQRIQDEEKRRVGALNMKSNQGAITLAALFIGLPLGTLLVLFVTGVLPNPFEVCIQGGTTC